MFGTISFTYTPSDETPKECDISVSFSSEVTLDEITVHFEHFLKALGYPLNFSDSVTISRQADTNTSFTTHPCDFSIGGGFDNMNYPYQNYGGYYGKL